jgi:hypothetical protein
MTTDEERKANNARKAKSRQPYYDKGLVQHNVWCYPQHKPLVTQFAKGLQLQQEREDEKVDCDIDVDRRNGSGRGS